MIKRTLSTMTRFFLSFALLIFYVVDCHDPIYREVSDDEVLPDFASVIQNVTVPLGRDVQLNCVVENLGGYRVAWIKVESKAILTIHNRIISHNYRISLSHSDDRHFALLIRNVQETDKGGYMCQINTAPMKSQIGYLDVLVPPDIIVEESSSDVVTREGSNVSMTCKARGYPSPNITWRREDNEPIPLGTLQGKKLLATAFEGENMSISRVSRLHMGAYLCIAKNGVLPAVSRRIILHVQFAPVMWVPNQIVGAILGDDAQLDCHSEAYPSSLNHWAKDGVEEPIINNSTKYETLLREKTYKTHMKLTIRRIGKSDYGMYKCYAKNSLGTSEHTVQLYEIVPPTQPTTTTTTASPILITKSKTGKEESPSYQRIQSYESIVPDSLKPMDGGGNKVKHKEEVLPAKAEVVRGSKTTGTTIQKQLTSVSTTDDSGGGGGSGVNAAGLQMTPKAITLIVWTMASYLFCLIT